MSPLFNNELNSPNPLTVDVLSSQIGFFLLSKLVLPSVKPLYETKTESATDGFAPLPSRLIHSTYCEELLHHFHQLDL